MRKCIFLYFLIIPIWVNGIEPDTTRTRPRLSDIDFLGLDSATDTGKNAFRLFDFPLYFESGLGIDASNYRDFATSPLVYSGYMGVVPLSLMIMDSRREMTLSMRNSFGPFTITIGNEDIFAFGYVNNIRFGHLVNIKAWSTPRFNFKLGGVYDFTTIFRMNEALMNNASGYEIFSTLSGSVKLTADLSRKKPWDLKLLWWRIHFDTRQRELGYRLDLGIMNSTLRNGYAYIGQELLLNNLVIFDNYEFDWFSGYRVGAQFDYTWYLKTHNGIRFAYIWDAYFTGGDLPKFEMAHHIFQFSLLSKIK